MKNRPLCIICVGLMIAVWLCRAVGLPIFGEPALTPEEKDWISEEHLITVTGVVTERRISSDTVRYTLRHARVTFRDRQIPFAGLFVSTEYKPGNQGTDISRTVAAEPGDLLRAEGTLRAIEPAGNPGQFDSASYYACQKLYYRLWANAPPDIHPRQNLRKLLFRIRERLTETYAVVMQENSAGILSAMLLGDKAFLTEDSRRNFQAGGCLHLLVISGLHVTLLGMGLLQILLRLRMPQTPACFLSGMIMLLYTAMTGFPVAAMRACLMFLVLLLARVLRRSYDSASSLSFAAIVLLLANPGYLFHAGFQLSFAAAASASLVVPLLSRGLHSRTSLIAPMLGKILHPGTTQKNNIPVDTLSSKTADFVPIFSTVATHSSCAISAENRISSKKYKEPPKRTQVQALMRMLRENTILWGSVQLCTLPFTAYYFYEIPVWSLPLNLLLVPCVQYVLGAGVAGSLAVLLFPAAARWLLLPADLGLGLYDRILSLARIIPGSSVVCGKPALWKMAVYYVILLYVLYRLHGQVQKKKLPCSVLLAVACLILFLRLPPAFSLTMLDVGQGDCLVIRTGNTVFLSDGGSTNVQEVGKYRMLPYLESEGISCVDGVCISHNDADHINGIEEMLTMIAEKKTALRIGHVFMPVWMRYTEDGHRIAAEAAAAGAETGFLQRGDRFRTGELSLEVLHPFRMAADTKEFQDRSVTVVDGVPYGGCQSGNAGSLVLQVTYRNFTALLTGDLEKEGEAELLPYLQDIDCLKVGHHGSRWSSSEEFLEIVQPELALVSAPKKSMYGHPHQEALDRLKNAGAQILATRDRGAVTLYYRRKHFCLRTFLP